MISALLILDAKGRAVVTRDFRGDIPTNPLPKQFIHYIIESEDEEVVKPVFVVEGICFAYIKQQDLYFLAVGQANLNVILALEMINKMIEAFFLYFGKVEEECIRDNFSMALELLDEMVDFGYPQNFEPSALQTAVLQESKKQDKVRALPPPTGAVSWRPDNPAPYYKTNQVFLDVIEEVNFTVNADGGVIQSEIHGSVVMRCELTGTPDLTLTLNDKLASRQMRTANPSQPSTSSRRNPGVELGDVRFHQCVRLSQFEKDRTISFIPPDTPFELMKYVIGLQMRALFQLEANSFEYDGSRWETKIRISTKYKERSKADQLVLRIPVPSDADTPRLDPSHGTCTYDGNASCIIWTMQNVMGQQSMRLTASMGLPTIRANQSNQQSTLSPSSTPALSGSVRTRKQPPIEVSFDIPYFTLSGIQVRSLRILERHSSGSSGGAPYTSLQWIRYITKSGTYINRQKDTQVVQSAGGSGSGGRNHITDAISKQNSNK